jgi:hypothetical protein
MAKKYVQILVLIALVIFSISQLLENPRAVSISNALMGRKLNSVKHVAESKCVNTELIVVAGTIRNDGGGWYVLNDIDHVPVNIASVTSSLHSINIEYLFTAKRVVTLISSPDEVLAACGVHVGAAAGLKSADLTVSRSGLFGVFKMSPVAIDTTRYPWSNIWIYGLFEAENFSCF